MDQLAQLVSQAQEHLDQDRYAQAGRELGTLLAELGVTTVTLWTLSVGADLGEGLRDYERILLEEIDVTSLHSRSHTGRYHFDVARALAQHGGARDDEAIRHLTLADQAAPVWMRNHPIVRELTADLTERARRQLWDVDSLLDRFGLARQGSPGVNN